MKLIEMLRGALASPQTNRLAYKSGAGALGGVVAMHMGGRAAWTPRDVGSLIRVGYATNAIAYRCTRLICDSAAAIPLLLHKGEERVLAHPVLTLLEKPNPAQSGPAFLEAIYGHLQSAGNAYVRAGVSKTGHPLELHALRPDRVNIVLDADGWPEAYEYQVDKNRQRFEIDRFANDPPIILHLKCFDPLDDHYGMSPLKAAAKSIDVHNAAGAWSKALLDNAARPSGAVVYKGGDGQAHLTESQYERLVEELESNHQGARNAGRPMLLEGGLDWKPMGFSPADMEFQKTKDAAAREIALAFGVPPMLLGLPGDNTYSNYQEANRAFTRQTLLPLLRRTAADLSGWFSAAYRENLALTPDLDALPALASERDDRWRRITQADFLTPDEKRKALGLPSAPLGAKHSQQDDADVE
ncbi:MAG: phage portal protein [Pseudomonadota bacterium]